MRLIAEISKWFDRIRPFAGRSHDTTKEKKNNPTIILTLPDGRKLAAGDLRGRSGMMTVRQGKLLDVTGNIRYEIIGTDNVPTAAESLHQRAREAGRHGETTMSRDSQPSRRVWRHILRSIRKEC